MYVSGTVEEFVEAGDTRVLTRTSSCKDGLRIWDGRAKCAFTGVGRFRTEPKELEMTEAATCGLAEPLSIAWYGNGDRKRPGLVMRNRAPVCSGS